MNEDQVHQMRCAQERFFLAMETNAENSKHLWSVREQLRDHCMKHWSVIGFSKPATLEQVYRPSVTGPEFKKIFEQSLNCSLLMLYTDTCVVSFGDHSACSGHFGCKILSWVANEEWVDTIGLAPPAAQHELMAWAICLLRIWSLPILRSFWTSAAALPAPRNLGQSFFKGSYDVPTGTHPQEVMHGILSRVSSAWKQNEWTVVSAVPFKEVSGIANNIGGMSYSFPIAKPTSVRQFRRAVSGAKWQVLCTGQLYRRFLSGGGGGASWPGSSAVALLGGWLFRRFQKWVPDPAQVRDHVDAVFTFVSMKFEGHTIDNIRMFACQHNQPKSPFMSDRNKVFISGIYDKSNGRVHVTLTVNHAAAVQPHEATLNAGGLDRFEPLGMGKSLVWA